MAAKRTSQAIQRHAKGMTFSKGNALVVRFKSGATWEYCDICHRDYPEDSSYFAILFNEGKASGSMCPRCLLASPNDLGASLMVGIKRAMVEAKEAYAAAQKGPYCSFKVEDVAAFSREAAMLCDLLAYGFAIEPANIGEFLCGSGLGALPPTQRKAIIKFIEQTVKKQLA